MTVDSERDTASLPQFKQHELHSNAPHDWRDKHLACDRVGVHQDEDRNRVRIKLIKYDI
jgi:hypothetical protein